MCLPLSAIARLIFHEMIFLNPCIFRNKQDKYQTLPNPCGCSHKHKPNPVPVLILAHRRINFFYGVGPNICRNQQQRTAPRRNGYPANRVHKKYHQHILSDIFPYRDHQFVIVTSHFHFSPNNK